MLDVDEYDVGWMSHGWCCTCQSLVSLTAHFPEVTFQRILGLLKREQFLGQLLCHLLLVLLMLLQAASESHQAGLN